jgi:hypothetical protein
MLRENMSTLSASLRLQAVETPILQNRSGSAAALAELFGPLDGLLRGGGASHLGKRAPGHRGLVARPRHSS